MEKGAKIKLFFLAPEAFLIIDKVGTHAFLKCD